MFWKKKAPSGYYKSKKDVYARITGKDSFVKSFWNPQSGELAIEEVTLSANSLESIFQPPTWSRISKKQYEKHIEPVAAAGRGVRGAKSIEFVFQHDGVNYFRYKDYQDYPIGRAKEIEAVIFEQSFMLGPDDIDAFFDYMEGGLSGKDGNIDVGAVASVVREVNARRKLGFDTNILRRIAAAVFFTEDEDTSRIDWEGMRAKLKAWENLEDAFFFTLPVRDFFPFDPESIGDLKGFLTKAKARLMISNALLQKLSKGAWIPSPVNLATLQPQTG